MLRTAAKYTVLALITIVFVGCNGVPSYVIQPDDMAELVADLHTGDAVVELNYQYYATDSSRRALKQAILHKHGITQEQLDTSYMWYGAHLKEYQQVYYDAEAILQERLDHSNAIAIENARMSVSGDSVDVWQQSKTLRYGNNSARSFVTFNLKGDKNTKPGDSYTWRAKFFNLTGVAYWNIIADYADGTTETLNGQFSGDGWQSLTFFADSTRNIKNVYGSLELSPSFEGDLYIDSIQLVRNRLNPQMYVQRYRQRLYDNIR